MAKYKRHYKKQINGVKQQDDEIIVLENHIEAETPDRGYTPPLNQVVAFRALPLSEATLRGLEDAGFETMTAIQNACIPHLLAGRDVLGAARTGSGKTLAFLIPLLEKLYRSRWSFGPGGLILSPTRELAVQIFHVLKKIGKHHNLSAGLVVGGKKEFRVEQQHVGGTHILVATPGRLLQHLEQTPNFDVSELQILVLDEADRILDMGFRSQMLHILEYLPNKRQTCLFSATQTKKVSDLATLSLHKPEYLGVHDKEASATPDKLIQSVVVVPLEHKLNMVYSFIKAHLKNKSILFLASCSQVRFAWQLFCALQPGIPVMALHGKLVQTKRTKIYLDFVQRPHAVLFATDVAARGLDFKGVDWVVQVDAPEDRDCYIHRVGRTARYHCGGKSLLCVTPQEESNGILEMLQQNNKNKIPLQKLAMNPSKTVLVSQRAASLLASNPQLQSLGKKAFRSYLRSIHLMPNKTVFQISELPLDDYAASLGLPMTPNLKFLHKQQDRQAVRESKNVDHKLNRLKQQIKAEKLAKRVTKMNENKKERTTRDEEQQGDEEDDLLVVKKRHEWSKDKDSDNDDASDGGIHEVTQSRHAKRIKIDGGAKNKRIVFDEDGAEHDPATLKFDSDRYTYTLQQEEKDALAAKSQENTDRVRQRLEENVQQDVLDEKERVRELHRKRRIKKRQAEESHGGEFPVTLGNPNGDESSNDEGDDDSQDSSRSSDGDETSSVDVEAQQDMALAMIRNNL